MADDDPFDPFDSSAGYPKPFDEPVGFGLGPKDERAAVEGVEAHIRWDLGHPDGDHVAVSGVEDPDMAKHAPHKKKAAAAHPTKKKADEPEPPGTSPAEPPPLPPGTEPGSPPPEPPGTAPGEPPPLPPGTESSTDPRFAFGGTGPVSGGSVRGGDPRLDKFIRWAKERQHSFTQSNQSDYASLMEQVIEYATQLRDE